MAAIQQQPTSHRGPRGATTRQAMSEIGGVMSADMSVPDSIALAKKRLEINRSVLLKRPA